ncbi:unnamed protein product [Clavelina lepadiformis]|uniref:Uncharacterized protein n=1 Tax=Clavelina lepadiformis TaxID=159417 RepID=A0ABP0F4H4_CLALP
MDSGKPDVGTFEQNAIALNATSDWYSPNQGPYPPNNTNVVVVQPSAGPYTSQTTTVVTQQPVIKRPWSSQLCDCFNDMNSCFMTFCFGHFYLACVAQRMGEHCCVGCGLPGMWPMRTAMRERHNIEGDMCNDCCVSYWCGLCAICQLSREMDRLGYPKNC